MESVPCQAQEIVIAGIRQVASDPFVIVHLRVVHEHLLGLVIPDDGIQLFVRVDIPIPFKVRL